MVTALLPLLLSTAYFGGDRSRLFDQDFGVGLRPEQLLLSRYDYPLSARDRAIFDLFDNSNYLRMFPEVFRSSITGGLSKVYRDKNDGNWKVLIDVKQFKVEEIEVKVVDNYVVVTGKHEEKQDEHGLISRQFVRRYEIPKDVEPDTISSEISSDGVLTIKAPTKDTPENENERKVKIELTGKPALKSKEEPSDKKMEDSSSSTATPTTRESTTKEL